MLEFEVVTKGTETFCPRFFLRRDGKRLDIQWKDLPEERNRKKIALREVIEKETGTKLTSSEVGFYNDLFDGLIKAKEVSE